ncbi:YciI family protein [Nocardioides sp. GCM10027113]|uniref:YciI family protein n=1 Tax=unclassified Nocardioides TaxID=2615069 RepID=UPI00361F685F
MTEYILLIPDDEEQWAARSEDERQRTYDRHREFAAALAARGHKVTGGAELAPSKEARTVRRRDGALHVTEGPYAEAVEQLSGFYLIESDDLDDLVECVGMLAVDESPLELRACRDGSSS